MCRNVIFWGRFNNRRPQPGARVHLVLLGASVQLCALRIVEVLVQRANPEELGRTALRPLRVRGLGIAAQACRAARNGGPQYRAPR